MSSVTREKTGLYVVVYEDRPGWKSLDAFLRVTSADDVSTDAGFEQATRFTSDAEARAWLARFPNPFDPTAHLPGKVLEVIREVRLVPGGESMEDLKALLREIRDARA